MTRRLSLLALAALLLASAPLSAMSQTLSGRYGPLALAVGEDGVVHGVFAERRVGNGTMDAPQFRCVFLLEGRVEGGRASVETWFPGEAERIAGDLRLGPQASLQLHENHGGCHMTSGDMKSAPYELFMDEEHEDWTGAGLVTAERAVLRPGPAEAAGRTRPYLVKFDAVVILARRPGWVRVEYLEAENAPVAGWLRETGMASSTPPRP